jgi:hypothetical protein
LANIRSKDPVGPVIAHLKVALLLTSRVSALILVRPLMLGRPIEEKPSKRGIISFLYYEKYKKLGC